MRDELPSDNLSNDALTLIPPTFRDQIQDVVHDVTVKVNQR